jgi:hypothetical protein
MEHARAFTLEEVKELEKHAKPISKEEFYKRVQESINAKKLKSSISIGEASIKKKP